MDTELIPHETPQSKRRSLRTRLLAAREALLPEECEQGSALIRQHLQHAFPQLASRRVAFCWPIRNEPDLRPLMVAWLAAGQAGFMALLPVAEGPARPLAFRAWTPNSVMGADRYGIPCPIDGRSATPEALLIPLNAFDPQCYRLGYGGGFFDRTLAALAESGVSGVSGSSGPQSRPLAIGVGFELSRVDTVYPQTYDVRLDAVVTEAGVHWPAA